MKRTLIGLGMLFFALRWISLAVLVLASPRAARDFAIVLFGEAGADSPFAQLYLPAIGLAEFQPLRFAAGELGWAAVTVGATYAVAYLFKPGPRRPKPAA